MVLQFQLKER